MFITWVIRVAHELGDILYLLFEKIQFSLRSITESWRIFSVEALKRNLELEFEH